MNRREFSSKLLLTGLTSPFLANRATAQVEGEPPSFESLKRVYLKLQRSSMQPDRLDFSYGDNVSYRINLRRKCRQFNEDRIIIHKYSPPPLKVTFQEAEKIGEVGVTNNAIICKATKKLGMYYDGIFVANGATSYLVGRKLTHFTKTEKIPFFSDLPVVGSLYRNKSKNDEKNYLLVLIRPSIVNVGG